MFTDTLITSGITVAVLLAFAIVMGRRQKAANASMAWVDHFQVKGFEAKIDRARNEVLISAGGDAPAFRALLGHLVVEYKVETTAMAYEKRPKRRFSLTRTSARRRLLKSGSYVAPSSGWKETVWTSVETGKTWVRLLAVRLPVYYAQHWGEQEERHTSVLTGALDVPLPNGNAHAFKLWLEYHSWELFPDRAAVRATWDQTCAELLRACRQQRDYHANAAMAFETWSFSAQPSIAYLMIETDGAAFWASGDTPMLEPIEGPCFKLVDEKLTVSSGDDSRSFPVPADRLASLQALQRRGVIQMGRARPFSEAFRRHM
jgi:hypothetical protein